MKVKQDGEGERKCTLCISKIKIRGLSAELIKTELWMQLKKLKI
jgi:hypothetical protein